MSSYVESSIVSYINNGGNLGIGTSDPEHKLHVNTSTTYDGIVLYNGNNRLGKIGKDDNNSGYWPGQTWSY